MITLNIRSGANQIDAARYTIVDLCANEQVNAQADEQPNAPPNAQAEEQANEHIITTLHLYFNYINKGENQNQFVEISAEQKNGLINLLKKLEIYASNEVVENFFSSEKKLEVEVQYFAIKELYFSPYKCIFKNLTRQEFLLKFYKTDKYIGLCKENVKRFMDYFIKCLHEKADKGEC